MVIRAQGSLNLSRTPTLFLTSTNIYQTQGLWLWCPILGAVAVISGPQFSSAILGKVGNASGAGGTSAGMKIETLGSQIRLVLDLHCGADTSPSSEAEMGRVPKHRKTKTYKLSKSGQRRKELGGGVWGNWGYLSECQLAGVHFPPEIWPFYPLPTTEMAQDEALAE